MSFDNSSESVSGFSGLNVYSGQWTENEIIHLLKRTMFGASKQDVDYFKTKTLSDTINELLNPTAPLPSPPMFLFGTNILPRVLGDTLGQIQVGSR